MRVISVIFGGIWAMALVVGGICLWNRATDLAALADFAAPQTIAWAARCGGVALLGAAQAILLTFVVDAVYRRGRLSDLFRLSAALIFMVAVAGAIVLALAGR